MSERIAWIDVETTGLSDEDHILEVGCKITDMGGNDLVEGFHEIVAPKPDSWDRMCDYVREMHTASMLWHQCTSQERKLEGIVLEELEDFLQAHAVGAYLGGYSVHFDRRMITAKRPTCLAVLSHRHIDVSSLSLALTHSTGRCPKGPGYGVPHRAYADCKEAIGAYQHALRMMKRAA